MFKCCCGYILKAETRACLSPVNSTVLVLWDPHLLFILYLLPPSSRMVPAEVETPRSVRGQHIFPLFVWIHRSSCFHLMILYIFPLRLSKRFSFLKSLLWTLNIFTQLLCICAGNTSFCFTLWTWTQLLLSQLLHPFSLVMEVMQDCLFQRTLPESSAQQKVNNNNR